MRITKTHLQEARDWTTQHHIELAKEREQSRHEESELREALNTEKEKLRVAKLELMTARRAFGTRRRRSLLTLDRVARRIYRDTKSRGWRNWSSCSNKVKGLERVLRSFRRRCLNMSFTRFVRHQNTHVALAVIAAKRASAFAAEHVKNVCNTVRRLVVLKCLNVSCRNRFLDAAFSSWYVEVFEREARVSYFHYYSIITLHTHTHTGTTRKKNEKTWRVVQRDLPFVYSNCVRENSVFVKLSMFGIVLWWNTRNVDNTKNFFFEVSHIVGRE